MKHLLKRAAITGTAILLLIGMLCSTACSSESKKETPTTTTTSTDTTAPTETMDSLDARQLVNDALPDDLDFGGMPFRSLVSDGFPTDVYVEEETGDIVDDAIYQRNRAVEERLNVVIEKPTIETYLDASKTIRSSVLAGDDSYDLYVEHMVLAGSDTMQKIFYNWYDLKYVDFKQPWYPQNTIEALTVNNTMFLTISDMLASSIYNTYCMYYDKNKAADYDIPDLYDIVSSGKWTFDKLQELTKDVYQDVNGDGKKDADDYYGFSSSIDSNVVTFLWAFDDPIMKINGNNEVEMLLNNEKTINIIEKLRNYFYNSNGVYVASVYTDFIAKFQNSTALFVPRLVGETLTFFRDVDNYGIVPFPKYDENQENYLTMLDGSTNVMAVPLTTPNLDMVGAVVEAMSSYSWKNVIPQYYDVALKVKGTRDDESIQMLDYCMDGRVIDFPYVYDNWKGYAFALVDLLNKNSTEEFSSFYAKREKQAKKQYEQVLELFTSYKQE